MEYLIELPAPVRHARGAWGDMTHSVEGVAVVKGQRIRIVVQRHYDRTAKAGDRTRYSVGMWNEGSSRELTADKWEPIRDEAESMFRRMVRAQAESIMDETAAPTVEPAPVAAPVPLIGRDAGTFDSLAVEAALCLWEAVCDWGDTKAPWQDWRDQSGTMALRRAIMDMGATCSADWFTLSPDQMGVGKWDAFDWEYCPNWLVIAIDWEGCAYGSYPQIRPTDERLAALRGASEVTSC